MPTVLRVNGFEIVINTHDHLPRHVHVFRGDGEIIINLDDIAVRDVWRISGRDARKAQEIVAANRDFLLAEWERVGPIS